MNGEEQSTGDLRTAFEELGDHLRALLKTAWESEERQKIQSEIAGGLRQLEGSLREMAADLSEGETGRRIKEEIEEIGERVRGGELEAKARSELLRAVSGLNAELEKLRATWEASEAASAEGPEQPQD